LACIAALAAAVDLSKLPAPSTRKGLTYAADIRPIFEASCFRCHGDPQQKGGLRLDSLQAVLKGSDDGKVITPGKSRKSLLVLAISLGIAGTSACSDDDDDMPDGGADGDADADGDGDADAGLVADASCGPGADAGACSLVADPDLPGCMEVGSGSFSFQPLTPGNEAVEVIHGPQGGYHVFGSLRVRDVALEPGVSVLFHFRPAEACDDIMLPEAKTPIDIAADAFRNAGDGWRAAYGFLVILDTTTPDDLNGRRFVLGAEMTDAAGDVYRGESEVVAEWAGD
jgi:hypothetical protein